MSHVLGRTTLVAALRRARELALARGDKRRTAVLKAAILKRHESR